MKLTKIIATIGPSCEDEKMIEKLILKGVNIFRFNFKHNTVKWHEMMIRRVRKVASRLNLPIGTLIDLQGPEIRLDMPMDEITIKKGKEYILGMEEIGVSHPQILEYVKENQQVVCDDGAFKFTLHKKADKWILKSKSSGLLKNKKTLTIPGGEFPISLLVERDFEGIRLAGQEKLDFIALSFVRSAGDIDYLRKELKKHDVSAKIVSKIETQKAITYLNQILKISDVVMVARGDLGVELPLEQIPYYQKHIIKKCLEQGIPVITATQMLQSMISSPYPTRAEVSDVANAVYDFTDAVMLSAETAMGAYPAESVSSMAQTAAYTEHASREDVRIKHSYDLENQTELICDAAYNLYHKAGGTETIEGFIVFTNSGMTAETISRYRPKVPIYAFVPDIHVATKLSVNFGVMPFVQQQRDIEHATQFLVVKKHLLKGKRVIVLSSDNWGTLSPVPTIRVVTV